MIGVLYSDELKNYDFGPGHPFRGDRFERFRTYFHETLEKSGIFEVVMNDELASDADLLLSHQVDYIRTVEKASNGMPIPDLWRFQSGDNINPQTRNFPIGIEKAARVIVKNALLACDFVQKRRFEKAISLGGGLHHAKPRYGEGFCIYNDVVIAARHLIERHGLDRILILDTDAHAGNGTCDAFYSDHKVLFIDLHQKFIYPGTGYEDDIGESKGKGFTVNIPLPAYAGDEAYRLVFDEIVSPLAEEFTPQIIIRNGGSDPHPSDEITQLGLTLEGFKFIGSRVREMAEICDGKEVDLIVSGYKPEVLARAWTALFSGLTDVEVKLEESIPLRIKSNQALEKVESTVETVKRNIHPYWRSMKT